LLSALGLALANGANDNFKGVATLYGSGSLRYRGALAWATVSTLMGSLLAIRLADGLVQRFSGKGLVAQAVVTQPAFLLAVALAALVTVTLATRFGLPVSTTHALTGGLLGAAVVAAGPAHVSYATLGSSVVLPLLLSPALAAVLTAGLYAALHALRKVLGIEANLRLRVGSRPLPQAAGVGAIELSSHLALGIEASARASTRVGSSRPSPGLYDAELPCGDHDNNTRHVQQRVYGGALLGLSLQGAIDHGHLLTAGAVGFARGLNDTPKIAALLAEVAQLAR
jgi:PiT family inorganic phosphate transporter